MGSILENFRGLFAKRLGESVSTDLSRRIDDERFRIDREGMTAGGALAKNEKPRRRSQESAYGPRFNKPRAWEEREEQDELD